MGMRDFYVQGVVIEAKVERGSPCDLIRVLGSDDGGGNEERDGRRPRQSDKLFDANV
jgi:hypothetical protein